jgi:hypothetical protein
MSIVDSVLPASPFIRAETNSYFWAIGFDSLTRHIFLADPKGFVQNSTIYEYDESGVMIKNYFAGIGTNGFLFK